jgi:glycosyltransferase involved in cell wall biosynthesis
MSHTEPLVSVCIPTYNRPKALAEVVRSILAQTYRPIEVIVTDDGDSEQTIPHLAPYADRIRYEANPRRLGIYGNWNRSISRARGELVGVYHDHDNYPPTFVERSVELFRKNPSVGIVHVAATVKFPEGWIPIVHHDLPEVAPGRWFAERQAWRWPSYVAHGAMMVRKELYDRLGTFDESTGMAADMDMLTRFCLECDIGYVKEPLYGYSGREPGDFLFDVNWDHVVEYARVRRRNFERLYADRPAMRELAMAVLRAQLDERLLHQLLYMLARHRRDKVEEGLCTIGEHGSPVARRLASLVSAEGPLSSSLRDRSYRAYKWAQRAARSLGSAGNA